MDLVDSVSHWTTRGRLGGRVGLGPLALGSPDDVVTRDFRHLELTSTSSAC